MHGSTPGPELIIHIRHYADLLAPHVLKTGGTVYDHHHPASGGMVASIGPGGVTQLRVGDHIVGTLAIQIASTIAWRAAQDIMGKKTCSTGAEIAVEYQDGGVQTTGNQVIGHGTKHGGPGRKYPGIIQVGGRLPIKGTGVPGDASIQGDRIARPANQLVRSGIHCETTLSQCISCQ